MTDAYSLSSGNVKTMKIKAEHNRSHQEQSDQPFEGWKTRKSSHVEMIGMSTLLEGCVENTELHCEEWLKRNSPAAAKQRFGQILS